MLNKIITMGFIYAEFDDNNNIIIRDKEGGGVNNILNITELYFNKSYDEEQMKKIDNFSGIIIIDESVNIEEFIYSQNLQNIYKYNSSIERYETYNLDIDKDYQVKKIQYSAFVSINQLTCYEKNDNENTIDNIIVEPYNDAGSLYFKGITNKNNEFLNLNFILNYNEDETETNIMCDVLNYSKIECNEKQKLNIVYKEVEQYFEKNENEFNGYDSLSVKYEISNVNKRRNYNYKLSGELKNLEFITTKYNENINLEEGNSNIIIDISNLIFQSIKFNLAENQKIQIKTKNTNDIIQTSINNSTLEIKGSKNNDEIQYILNNEFEKFESSSSTKESNINYDIPNNIKETTIKVKDQDKIGMTIRNTILNKKTEVKFTQAEEEEITVIKKIDVESESEVKIIMRIEEPEETNITVFKDVEIDKKKDYARSIYKPDRKLNIISRQHTTPADKYYNSENIKVNIKGTSNRTNKIYLRGKMRYRTRTDIITEKNKDFVFEINDGAIVEQQTFITEYPGNIQIINNTNNEANIKFEEIEEDSENDDTSQTPQKIKINKLTIDSKSNVNLSFPETLTEGEPDIGTIELLGDSTVSFENLKKTVKPVTLLIPYGKDISDVIVGDIPSTLEIIKENAPQTTDEQLKEMENKIDELTDKINNLNSKLNKALAVLILTNDKLFN